MYIFYFHFTLLYATVYAKADEDSRLPELCFTTKIGCFGSSSCLIGPRNSLVEAIFH